jgi:peptidoglycan/xylan/chitin deacetylase (PgdA/CDA1 family)
MRGALALVLVALLLGCIGMRAQTVALTFDDLPETSNIPRGSSRATIARRLIEELTAAKVPPVYGFVNAGTLDDPDVKGILERWRAAGFLLGNHTYSHFNLDEKPLSVYEQDIARNEPVLRRLMAGEDWHWFRYPFLAEGGTLEKRDGVRNFLTQRGYRIAEVTINFDDDAWNDAYARCMVRHQAGPIEQMKTMYLAAAEESIRFSRARSQQLFHRDISYILLLHMGGFAPVMLPKLLALFEADGFRFVTLPEAASDPVYERNPGVLNDGGTFLDALMAASDQTDGPHTLPPTAELKRLCR